MKNSNDILLTNTQDSIPQAAAGLGTIETVGINVYGSAATKFTTAAQINDWLYIKAQNEFRKIISIESDRAMTIDGGFTADVAAGSSYHITPKSRFTSVAGVVRNAGAATIDGISYLQGATFDRNKGASHGATPSQYIDPIDVDATGTEVLVQVQS